MTPTETIDNDTIRQLRERERLVGELPTNEPLPFQNAAGAAYMAVSAANVAESIAQSIAVLDKEDAELFAWIVGRVIFTRCMELNDGDTARMRRGLDACRLMMQGAMAEMEDGQPPEE